MKISYFPFSLRFKYPFCTTHGTRDTTEVVYVKLEHEGATGFGEAAMPPYLGETTSTAYNFLSKLDLMQFNDPFNTETILEYADSMATDNNAAKAAIDIALHDLQGKLCKKPVYELFGLKNENMPLCTYTIGTGERPTIAGKLKEGGDFKILKIKLGSSGDSEFFESILVETSKLLCVDANGGWTDKHKAYDMICRLHENNVMFIEQPMPAEMVNETAWLREKSPIPIIADEAIFRLTDLEKMKDFYDGINVKLMKSTGLHEAFKMLKRAKELNMKILTGCMSESSCGVTAAAHLSSLADWADLDGPWLINNDPFSGMKIKDGRIELNKLPGTGAEWVT